VVIRLSIGAGELKNWARKLNLTQCLRSQVSCGDPLLQRGG